MSLKTFETVVTWAKIHSDKQRTCSFSINNTVSSKTTSTIELLDINKVLSLVHLEAQLQDWCNSS